MKKVLLWTKDKSKFSQLKKIAENKGLVVVKRNPEFIISLGGDGTLLWSERLYPGIPKLMIRDSKICKQCVGDNQETILDFIRMNAYQVKEYSKLEIKFNDKLLIAMNDVIIRNKEPNQAIRFDVFIDKKQVYEEVIGDGVLISTPFGSKAYFESITRENFESGIGLAFSNPVKLIDPEFLNDKQKVKIKIIRGDAQLAVDNNPKVYTLKDEDIVTIQLSKQKAKIITLEGFE